MSKIASTNGNGHGNAAEKIGKPETVNLPINLLRAALACASKEETRHYLNGVYLHAVDDNLRIVATDGHRLFVASVACTDMPSWAKDGIIIGSASNLKGKLDFISKDSSSCHVTYAKGAPSAHLSDLFNEATFRCDLVAGTFPNYQAVVGGISFDTTTATDETLEQAEFKPVSFNAEYIRQVGQVAKLISAEKDVSISVYARKAHEPTVITFPECPQAMMILMPVRQDKGLQGPVREMLSPAIKGTLAALRAHYTRNLKAASDSKDRAEAAVYEAKAAEFEARIKAIMDHAGDPSAIEGPKATADKPKADTTSKPKDAATKSQASKAKAKASKPKAEAPEATETKVAEAVH